MPAGKAGVFPSHDPGLATVLPRKGGMPEEPSPRQRPCCEVRECLCSCRRFPCPLLSGTEGRAGRGLRERGVCGIKVIFARVAELVDALDLESSGLSIRVQVPSLAPEFARTSPAWLWDVFVLRAAVQEASFLVRRRGRQRSSFPPRQRAGSSPPRPCCCMFLPRPACGEPAKGYPPSIPSCRGITGHTASDRGPAPSPLSACT